MGVSKGLSVGGGPDLEPKVPVCIIRGEAWQLLKHWKGGQIRRNGKGWEGMEGDGYGIGMG